MREAADLYEDFSGHRADHYIKVDTGNQKTGLTVGQCDGILYTTVRDGQTEHYIHRFKKRSRPALAASHDGKRLWLIGGNFTFTERGIVDN